MFNIRVFRSDKNFNHKVDEWLNGKSKVLFITGLSGSGKSTLAKKMGMENNVPVICLDGYLKKLMSKKYANGNLSSELYRKLIPMHGIEALLEENTERCIIEGGQILQFDKNKLQNYPTIVLKTSFIKSTIRAMLRDFTMEHWEKYRHIKPYFHVKMNIRFWKALKV